MQSSPVSALPGVMPAKAQAMDNVSGMPVAEAADDATFESLLAQQAQAQSSSQPDDMALFLGRQVAPLDKKDAALLLAGENDSSEAPAVFTDLAALFANLVQAAVPTQAATPVHANGQAAAPAVQGADVAGLGASAAVQGAVSADAGRNNPAALVREDEFSLETDVLPEIAVKPGKGAAEIAVPGKDLPLADIKPEVRFNGQDIVRNAGDTEVRGMNPAARPEFLQVAGVQGNNDKGVVAVSVEPRVGAPGWDGALGQKVVWLVNQRHQMAEMQLNPPNLGPLEVKITISNDQASALFVSHHGAVRDAIEAALPRLREMLADNGITLGNAQVSAESFPREQTAQGEGRSNAAWQSEAHDSGMSEAVKEQAGVMRIRTPGSVDIFA